MTSEETFADGQTDGVSQSIRRGSTMHGSSAGGVNSGSNGGSGSGGVISSPNNSEIDNMTTIVPKMPEEEQLDIQQTEETKDDHTDLMKLEDEIMKEYALDDGILENLEQSIEG